VTEERRSRTYARRRDLREAPLQDSFEAPGGHPGGHPGGTGRGPTTQELELYRDPVPPARLPDLSLEHLPEPLPGPQGSGERARAFVERWSIWAAGLGRPPRDPSGRRQYPHREGMLPPALFIAAGLGVAGLVGLLTGILVTAPGPGATAAAAVPPTVTVTQRVTQPPVTETRTRTRTRTATVTATATQAPPPAAGGGVLQPGSQGPAVAQLQQDLAALGLFQGQVNGQYDEQTRAAVQNFQARAGVTGDPPGVAGQATLDALARVLGRG
jgi:hypothetical protein